MTPSYISEDSCFSKIHSTEKVCEKNSFYFWSGILNVVSDASIPEFFLVGLSYLIPCGYTFYSENIGRRSSYHTNNVLGTELGTLSNDSLPAK